MCIAIWKKEGVEFLHEDMYRQCWRLNNDGGSISYWDEEADVWHVTKGLMTWDDWWDKFDELQTKDLISKDSAVFMHFRVGTAGKGFSAALTHPFPLADNIKDQGALEFSTRHLIGHNGTIGPGNKDGTASDTMLAVMNYFHPMWDLAWERDGEIKDERYEKILARLIDSSLSRWFVTHGRHIWLYGPWIDDKKTETTFSNDDYENPFIGYGGATIANGYGTGWLDTDALIEPNISIRSGDIKLYLDDCGMWDWDAWKELNGCNAGAAVGTTNSILTDNDDMETGDNKDELIMAVLDNNGVLVWAEEAEDDLIDDDMICCPDCASENVAKVSKINLADHACVDCGAMFVGADADIICYDKDLCDCTIGLCMYCNNEVLVESAGNCSECGAMIDPSEAAQQLHDMKGN